MSNTAIADHALLSDPSLRVRGSESSPDEAKKPAVAGFVVGGDQRYGLSVRLRRTGFEVGTELEVGH